MKKAIRKINRFIFLEKKNHHILFRFVSIFVIVAFAVNLFTADNQISFGSTNTFVQTSWSGGITANNAIHPTNQAGWNQFSASTTGMTMANAGADLQLVPAVGSANISFTNSGDYTQEDSSAGTGFSGGQASLIINGIDSYTKLLLHGDESSGSTSIADSAISPHTVTAVGNASTTNASAKWGNSIFLDGTGDSLSIPSSTDFDFGDGAFTVDFWINQVNTSGERVLFARSTDNVLTGGDYYVGHSNGALRFGGGNNAEWNTALTYAAGGWHHLAFVWNGADTQYAFLDGVKVSQSGITYFVSAGGAFQIGHNYNVSNLWGSIDEFRVSKGIARWTENFTPPTNPYSQYSTSQSYYITTATNSQLDTSGWSSIGGVSITQTTPTNTSIKYLVSFDGRTTWKYWNGSSWTTASGGLNDLQTSGMTKSALEAITQSQWESTGGFVFASGTLDFAADLATTDTTVAPSLDNIAVNYYSPQTLTSSPYNTSNASNLHYKIQWTENLPAGTDVKFQLRTAPNSAGSPGTWTSWLGPDGTSATYFTDPAGGESMPSVFTGGGNDQWAQYKVFLSGTDIATPTLSDVTLTYILNAAPEIQNVTASQGSDGKVNIAYETRDSDTDSGTLANRTLVTPSFSYWNGSSWSSITSGLATLATTTKTVNQSTFTQYSTTWTASTTIGSQYYSNAEIKVTVSDGEPLNSTAYSSSTPFILDTATPTGNSVKVSATTTPSTITLSSSDNSALQMKVGLNADLSDASWETYATSKTLSLATDPDTVYARFKDAYGNESATISASSQATPSNLMIQDNSNITANPDELRLFLAWSVVAEPSAGFGSYHIYRSTNDSAWVLLSSIGTRTTNYYTDSTPTLNTTYYYKVATVDSSGNASYLSATSTGIANGAQDVSEGGGGSTVPVISSVSSSNTTTQSSVVTWTTDTLSNSVVGYCASPCSDYTTNQASISSYVTSHSVAIAGLSSGTTYNYKVFSTNPSSNTASSSGYTLTTNNGPNISNVAVTSVNSVSADITWNTNIAASGYVVYSTTTPPSGGEGGWATRNTSRTVNLVSLTEGTKYYFYVKSKDIDDNWAYDYNIINGTSTYYTFTTPLDVVAPTLSSIDGVSVGDTSAVINWSTDEPATSKIEYGTVSGSYTSSTTLDSTLTKNHSVSLSGLSYKTIYYYRTISSDGNGNTATSSESSFTTLEQQIGKSQQNITVVVSGGGSGSGSTGVPLEEVNNLKLELGAVKKERDSFKKENDSLRDKIIGANLSGENLSPSEIISLVIDKFTEITDDLTESALTVQNQAQSEKLEKDIIPAVISLRQLAKLVPPPKLKTEPKVEIGPTEAVISWLTDKLATSVVYFSEAKDYNEKTPDIYTNSAEDSKNYVSNHKITLKGLSPLTDYHYRLMSESEAGARAYSTDFAFTTKPEAPVISFAKAEKSGDTSIVVTWRTNIQTNSAVVYTPIIAGKLEANKSRSEGVPEFSQEHIVTIPRLEPSTVYNLEISSVDHFGNVAVKKLEPMSIAKDQTPPVISQLRNEASILSGSANKVQAIFYWKTDEPSTTKVIFEKGLVAQGEEEKFSEKSAPNEELTMNHIAVVASWEPGQFYRFRAVSEDAFGNEAQSKTFTVVSPKQKDTVVDLIINNFSDTFDWTKKLGF